MALLEFIKNYRIAENNLGLMALILASYGAHIAIYKMIPDYFARAKGCHVMNIKRQLFKNACLLSDTLSSIKIITILGLSVCLIRAFNIRSYIDFLISSTLTLSIGSLVITGLISASRLLWFDKNELQQIVDSIDTAIYLVNGKKIRGSLINLDILEGNPINLVRLPNGEMTAIDNKMLAVAFIRQPDIDKDNLIKKTGAEGNKELILKIPQNQYSHREENFIGKPLFSHGEFCMVRMLKPTSNSAYVYARKELIKEASAQSYSIR